MYIKLDLSSLALTRALTPSNHDIVYPSSLPSQIYEVYLLGSPSSCPDEFSAMHKTLKTAADDGKVNNVQVLARYRGSLLYCCISNRLYIDTDYLIRNQTLHHLSSFKGLELSFKSKTWNTRCLMTKKSIQVYS
jgi:hypothetical protein